MEKRELRNIIKNKSASLSQEYISDSSNKIQRLFIDSQLYKNSSSIFVYVSMQKEPDTSLIIKTALKEGRRVYVPKCIRKGVMIPVEINSESKFISGFMNIPEPENVSFDDVNSKIDLAVLPCVSADMQGNRLGHGGGYYDVFLEKNKVKKVCLCFSELVCDKIPTENHDIKTDVLITEDGVYNF